MAKKRKNDTRLDPFATTIGNSNLDELLEQASAGDVIKMPSPSDPARSITLTCKVIPHDQIKTSTNVYGKNRRVQALLNEKEKKVHTKMKTEVKKKIEARNLLVESSTRIVKGEILRGITGINR